MPAAISGPSASRFGEALFRGLIWALVGVVFGFVFIILYQWLGPGTDLYLRYVGASAGAGALGALIYGSMRLTVIAATYAFVTVIGLFLLMPQAGMAGMMLVGGATGVLIGAIYGARVRSSRIFRAEAKTLAGAVAGLAASLFAVVPAAFVGPIPFPWLTVILCPATGLIYITLAPVFVERFANLLPAWAGGALAGAAVGALMGLAFTLMAGSVGGTLPAGDAAFVSRVTSAWPAAVAGAAAAGFAGGALRAALGARWVDL